MAGDSWTLKSIEELKAPTKGAIAIGPFGSRMKSDCYVLSGVQVIRGTNISDTRTLVSEMVCITPKLADQLGNAIVHADDLVFPHRGSIGLVGIVPRNNVERYALSSSLMKLTCDRRQVEPLFLFYFFRSADGQHELLKNASTVGTPGIGQPLSSLRSIKVSLPPLAEQKAIASVLGALDDKIELNRRMNATLESLARALFQSWFVDFDPVRAKLDGRQPVGMDAETAALFPDSFEDSPFGKIPLGWTVTDIGSFAINHDARREPVRENQRKSGPYPYYGASGIVDHVDGYLFDGEFLLVAEDGENLRTRKTPVAFRATGQFWVNNHAHVITGPTLGGTRYLLLALERADIGGYLTGSTIPKLSQQRMNRISFVSPSSELLDVFQEITSPMFERIDQNEHNSTVLATLRDTLLPKLLSGELSVGGAECAMENA